MAYTGTAAERLIAVREAIDKCLTSQAYTARGRSQQMALLATLREMEKELEQEVDAAESGMAVNYAKRMPPV
jgi:hypothetical protein